MKISATLTTFQVLERHMAGYMWLVATVLDSAGYPHFPTIRNEKEIIWKQFEAWTFKQ